METSLTIPTPPPLSLEGFTLERVCGLYEGLGYIQKVLAERGRRGATKAELELYERTFPHRLRFGPIMAPGEHGVKEDGTIWVPGLLETPGFKEGHQNDRTIYPLQVLPRTGIGYLHAEILTLPVGKFPDDQGIIARLLSRERRKYDSASLKITDRAFPAEVADSRGGFLVPLPFDSTPTQAIEKLSRDVRLGNLAETLAYVDRHREDRNVVCLGQPSDPSFGEQKIVVLFAVRKIGSPSVVVSRHAATQPINDILWDAKGKHEHQWHTLTFPK